MAVQIQDTEKIKQLFDGWKETIVWSCLQQVMGEIYADCGDHPASAMALLGDFCFFAGEPNASLVAYRPAWCAQKDLILVPQHDGWNVLIERLYGKRAKKAKRYATKKEPEVFDQKMLLKIAESLPEGCELRHIDETLYHLCRSISWCRVFMIH